MRRITGEHSARKPKGVRGSGTMRDNALQESAMMLRKISLAFVMLAICSNSALAKREPKYGKPHQLTADQATLVEKAIAREKIVIKNIQQRTPLVETYIQNMRPDEKLHEVPSEDFYMLSRVDFRKTFVDRPYANRKTGKQSFLKSSAQALAKIG